MAKFLATGDHSGTSWHSIVGYLMNLEWAQNQVQAPPPSQPRPKPLDDMRKRIKEYVDQPWEDMDADYLDEMLVAARKLAAQSHEDNVKAFNLHALRLKLHRLVDTNASDAKLKAAVTEFAKPLKHDKKSLLAARQYISRANHTVDYVPPWEEVDDPKNPRHEDIKALIEQLPEGLTTLDSEVRFHKFVKVELAESQAYVDQFDSMRVEFRQTIEEAKKEKKIGDSEEARVSNVDGECA